ncbi:MAG: single-stranded DNA-binding protein [Phycisphaerae bacterium]
MANFNKVILAGNLTRDPQLSMLPSNTPVCEFGMAINRKWKSQSGEARSDVCYVDLRIFGRRAEVINQYCSKGSPLLVEGQLRFDQWENKEGAKRSKLYVVVDNFEFLGGGRSGDRGDFNQGPARTAAAPAAAEAPDAMPPIDSYTPGGDDIPF